MTNRTKWVRHLTLLALLAGASAPAPALAEDIKGRPDFGSNSAPDEPSYPHQAIGCDIYGHWVGYDKFSIEFNWTETVFPEYMIDYQGNTAYRIRSLKKIYYENWPENKIGFYGIPSKCVENCNIIYVVYVTWSAGGVDDIKKLERIPEPFRPRCLLETFGYRGVKQGYVDEARISGSSTFIKPP